MFIEKAKLGRKGLHISPSLAALLYLSVILVGLVTSACPATQKNRHHFASIPPHAAMARPVSSIAIPRRWPKWYTNVATNISIW
ncbi:hypothetical protein WG66_004263 [Moniliophthora roreri]|nr:hypothetical protein WG66_004263 [Moniliophthora roreri]